MIACQHSFPVAAIANTVIAALSGLAGVFLGGLITRRGQDKERRQARVRDKLDKFYSPLLALRSQILAKSEVRGKVHTAANAEWLGLFKEHPGPGEKAQIVADRRAEFDAIFDYSEEQMKTELIPLYRRMIDLFATNMQFAEESTRKYFGLLVEFVEIWNRQLVKEMPPEVVLALKQDEQKLYPFYDELENQFRRLREQLERDDPKHGLMG
jgi:hypothetical protein